MLGRQTSDAVTTLGSGVDGSGAAHRDRLRHAGQRLPRSPATTRPRGGSIVNQVEDVYNGLGQLTGEYQVASAAPSTPRRRPRCSTATREMAGGANNSRLTSITYPNGYVLDYNYDSGLDSNISRISSLSDSSGHAADLQLSRRGYAGHHRRPAARHRTDLRQADAARATAMPATSTRAWTASAAWSISAGSTPAPARPRIASSTATTRTATSCTRTTSSIARSASCTTPTAPATATTTSTSWWPSRAARSTAATTRSAARSTSETWSTDARGQLHQHRQAPVRDEQQAERGDRLRQRDADLRRQRQPDDGPERQHAGLRRLEPAGRPTRTAAPRWKP